jgi:hypothetical protein
MINDLEMVEEKVSWPNLKCLSLNLLEGAEGV